MKKQVEIFIQEVSSANAFAPRVSVSTDAAMAALEFIRKIKAGAARGGSRGKRQPVKFDIKSVKNREYVRRSLARRENKT